MSTDYIVWDGDEWRDCDTLEEVKEFVEERLLGREDARAWAKNNIEVFELGKRVPVRVTPPRELTVKVG